MRRGKAWEMIRKKEALKSKGFDLLKALQSEITHELSSPCFQNDQCGSPGDFTLEWDTPHTQDVVLRKKCETGEEVAVSALIGAEPIIQGTYPKLVSMKVCITKPGLSSFLQFDCGVSNGSYDGPEFNINSAHHLSFKNAIGSRHYTGPLFSDLDPHLQAAFKDYLRSKGVGETLMNFLLRHMHKKEETQYVNWLQRLQQMLSPRESNHVADNSKKMISSKSD